MDAMATVRRESGVDSAGRRDLASISVVVPAYNEAGNLPRLLDDLAATLPGITRWWEVLVIDDGSADATPAVMQPWLTRPGFRYVRLSRNFGKEAALTAGLDRAQGDVVVLMDADGQHPVDMIPRMLDEWRAGAATVCALRQSRADESWAKRTGTKLFYRLANAGSPVPIPEGAGDFRLMDRAVVQALQSLPERNRFMKGLYAWVGFETRYLPYQPRARQQGRSTFSLRRLSRLAFTGITAFSNLPLRLWSGVGALIALFALAYGVWIVIEHWIEGHPIPGWPTLVTALMFFSGIQLLSIGILGEYIGRIFDEVKQRPIYLVSAEGGTDSSATAQPAPEAAAAAAAAGTTLTALPLRQRA
jgi:polyisoprenyl-phosphate glycosyltransferase